ncbi:hypothetical protein [Alteribacter aurantiacus]|uniref:hypothetical protein n=1 Tax=Alteribacter aurantiacus TaxID=254410 RepID=UPI000420FD1C|nr:hypothetical protein [Alteribacter aurantiacus]
MKRSGYRPRRYKGGYIRGYFLIKGDDYRFIVRNGHHRLAALALLGVKKIQVKLFKGWPPYVKIKHVYRWPGVKSGAFSKEHAKMIFNYYFESNGKQRALELGIYQRLFKEAKKKGPH